MKRTNWLKPSPLVVLGLLVVGVAVLGWLVIYLPQLQTAPLKQGVDNYRAMSPKPDPEKLATLEKGRIDSENAIRTGLIQGLGGTAVLIGIYFAYQNLKATQRSVLIAEEKQVTERFSKAVEMLGNSSSMHTRLGGIYALERIANDSDKDYWQVMEVLTAFVREESPYPPKDDSVEKPSVMAMAEEDVAEEGKGNQSTALLELSKWWKERKKFVADLPPLRTDIQAVMTVIGRRKHRFGKGEWEKQHLNLRKTNLRNLNAPEANLTGVILSEANLEGANLYRAQLEGAYLYKAYLYKAHLYRAQLEQASLVEAQLKGACLVEAQLKGADLGSANLEGVSLSEAHLGRAHLEGTDLSQVGFLTQEQLSKAFTDKNTILPDYLLATKLPQSETHHS